MSALYSIATGSGGRVLRVSYLRCSPGLVLVPGNRNQGRQKLNRDGKFEKTAAAFWFHGRKRYHFGGRFSVPRYVLKRTCGTILAAAFWFHGGKRDHFGGHNADGLFSKSFSGSALFAAGRCFFDFLASVFFSGPVFRKMFVPSSPKPDFCDNLEITDCHSAAVLPSFRNTVWHVKKVGRIRTTHPHLKRPFVGPENGRCLQAFFEEDRRTDFRRNVPSP